MGDLIVTLSMVKSSKLSTGLPTPRVECLEVTVIGEVQSGLVNLFYLYT